MHQNLYLQVLVAFEKDGLDDKNSSFSSLWGAVKREIKKERAYKHKRWKLRDVCASGDVKL